MSVVCPQRVLSEAVRLLENYPPSDAIIAEEIDNNILELKALINALNRDGITQIEEANP